MLKEENRNVMAKFEFQSQELFKLNGQLGMLADERNYLDGECQRLNNMLVQFHNESRSFSIHSVYFWLFTAILAVLIGGRKNI